MHDISVNTVSDAVAKDGKRLQEIFSVAEGIVNAGELNYKDFATPSIRKAVFLQLELSKPEATVLYGRDKTEEFRKKVKRFLTDLKDGNLSEQAQRAFSKEVKNGFPKLTV